MGGTGLVAAFVTPDLAWMLAAAQIVLEGIRFNSMYRVYVDTNAALPGEDYSEFWRSGFYSVIALATCAKTVMDGMAGDDEEEEAEEYYEEYYEEVVITTTRSPLRRS